MKAKNIVAYDSGDDSLTFINKDLKGAHTINTGLMLLTVTSDNIISAVELMGANKNFDIPEEVLENITSAKIAFDMKKDINNLIIKIVLHYENKEKDIIVSSNMNTSDISIKHQMFEATASA